MASRKPLYLDADGFPTEMSSDSDSMELQELQVNGSNGITMVSGTVTGLPLPTVDTDAASKAYVDSIAQGLTPKQAARVTTSGVDLTDHVGGASASFNSSGGAGGTGQFTDAPSVVDDITLAQGDRVLVKNEGGVAAHLRNGIYEVTATTTIWDRASDFDADSEAKAGSCVYVTEGTINEDTVWCVVTDDPITLNTTAIEWSKFSGAAGISAGDGLTKTGDTIDVVGGNGIIANANDIEVDPDSETGGDIQPVNVTANGVGLDINAIAGTGLSADGSANLRVGAQGNGLSGGDGTTLSIDPDTETGGNIVGVNVTANGVGLDADLLDGDGLEADGSGRLAVELTTLSGLAFAGTSPNATLGVAVDGTTITFNGSGELVASGAAEAERLENVYTTDGVGVTAGDPVYFSANNIVTEADAADASANRVFALAKTTVGASATVEVISDGPLEGVLTGLSPSAGDYVYLASGGGLTLTRPTGGNVRVVLVGTAINADDLFVEINFMGRGTVN
jgi:hypothetical protein